MSSSLHINTLGGEHLPEQDHLRIYGQLKQDAFGIRDIHVVRESPIITIPERPAIIQLVMVLQTALKEG